MFKIKFTHFQCTALRILTNAHIQVTYPPVEMINDDAKSLQSCPTLCDFMDCSPPGFSVHGILQARMLEWVAISFSRGSSYPRDGTCISYLLHWQAGSLPLAPTGKTHMAPKIQIPRLGPGKAISHQVWKPQEK